MSNSENPTPQQPTPGKAPPVILDGPIARNLEIVPINPTAEPGVQVCDTPAEIMELLGPETVLITFQFAVALRVMGRTEDMSSLPEPDELLQLIWQVVWSDVFDPGCHSWAWSDGHAAHGGIAPEF
jgi:hypothetical protein